MADFEIVDHEIRKFERDVEVGSAYAKKQVRNVVRKSTFETQARGRVRSPYKTGHLMGSISVDFIGSNADVAVGTTGPEANYGWFVENGTERQAPQPYMGPAADEVEPSFYAGLEAIDPLAEGL